MELYKNRQKGKQYEDQCFRAESSVNSCPVCGKHNEQGAHYCEYCGAALTGKKCPSCGAWVYEDEDICEQCGIFLVKGKCSFCGGEMEEQDVYCAECGAPKGGIVCPECHIHTFFSFCPVCGKPLTGLAETLLQAASREPLFANMKKLSEELKVLQETYNSRRDFTETGKPVCISGYLEKKKKDNERLRERLLAVMQQGGHTLVNREEKTKKEHCSDSEMEELIHRKEAELQQILDQMQTAPLESSALARNYSMARKPMGVVMGWKCNYKHFIHKGPQECACPQKGGKWVVGNEKTSEKTVNEK